MIYVIGDIHGMYDKLMSLMGKVKIDFEKDYLIFLGDYIDRGEKSIEYAHFGNEWEKGNTYPYLPVHWKDKDTYIDNYLILLGSYIPYTI